MSIDLRSDEGRQVLFDLVEDADIFFTNNRMGALKKMGLTYGELHERFQRLIYGHLFGYGLKGADAKLPGYDGPSFWARTGWHAVRRCLRGFRLLLADRRHRRYGLI